MPETDRPIILSYAGPAPAEPRGRHSTPITLFIVANVAFAIGVVLFALIYTDRLETIAWMLIGAGLATCIGACGPLSKDPPRFKRAAFWIGPACVLYTIAAIVVFNEVRLQESQIGLRANRPVVVVYIETTTGARLATWRITRGISLGAAAGSLFLLVYAGWRHVRGRRPATAAVAMLTTPPLSQ